MRELRRSRRTAGCDGMLYAERAFAQGASACACSADPESPEPKGSSASARVARRSAVTSVVASVRLTRTAGVVDDDCSVGTASEGAAPARDGVGCRLQTSTSNASKTRDRRALERVVRRLGCRALLLVKAGLAVKPATLYSDRQPAMGGSCLTTTREDLRAGARAQQKRRPCCTGGVSEVWRRESVLSRRRSCRSWRGRGSGRPSPPRRSRRGRPLRRRCRSWPRRG